MDDIEAKIGCVVIVIVVFAAAVGSCVGVNVKHGTGEKIGQIVRLNKQGLFVDTWEGQIIRGGMSDGSGGFGTVPFDFTIDNDALAEKARSFMEAQTEVHVHYVIEGLYSKLRSDSQGHFVVQIEPLEH